MPAMLAMPAVAVVRRAAAFAAVVTVPLAGCAAAGHGTAGHGTARPGHSATSQAPASAGGRARFSRPTDLANVMFPLRPGTEFVYRGRVVTGGRARPHTDKFTVTDLTKVVDGVRTVVAWDRDFQAGKLQEQELAFFAQDDAGNIWNFGEYPEEFNARGAFTGAPDTWIRGLPGSYGGLHMLARPVIGAQYREGLVPRIEFNDVSRVTALARRVCVPVGCYRGVLQINEWSPNDKAGGIQVKYYARGVGLVRVSAIGGDSREYLALTTVRHLDAAELAAVRKAVLAIDRRGFRVSKVYRATIPAIQAAAAS